MLTLLIDTSTAQQVVGLRDGAGALVSESNLAGNRAQEVVSVVDQLVSGSGGRSRITAVAVGVGPGGFTALRIGVSVARGIAATLGIPIAAVPSLGAVAMEMILRQGDKTLGQEVLATIDAQRGQRYQQVWAIADTGIIQPTSHRLIVTVGDHDTSAAGLVSARGMSAYLSHAVPKFGSWSDVVPDYGRDADAVPTASRQSKVLQSHGGGTQG